MEQAGLVDQRDQQLRQAERVRSIGARSTADAAAGRSYCIITGQSPMTPQQLKAFPGTIQGDALLQG